MVVGEAVNVTLDANIEDGTESAFMCVVPRNTPPTPSKVPTAMCHNIMWMIHSLLVNVSGVGRGIP